MKKLISLVLVLVSLFTILCCCPVPAAAVGEKITLISMEHDILYYREAQPFQLDVPALSKIKIHFYGDYDDNDEDDFDDDKFYETDGDVLIQIKDSNKKTVYRQETSIFYRDTDFTVTLAKGKYILYLMENTNPDEGEDDYSYFEYCFDVTAKLLEDIQLTYLRFESDRYSLAVGKSKALKRTQSPSYVNSSPFWFSSNEEVAEVNDEGIVTAKSFGATKITLMLGNKTASCIIYVTANSTPGRVYVGQSASLQKRFANVSGYNKAKWTSSDKNIATVSQSGVVTGKAKGSVVITATVKGVQYKQKVSVKNPSVKLDKATATLYVGKTKKLYTGGSVTLKAATDPANQKLAWTSSNNRVAKVSETGKVTAVAAGTATIKASFKYGGTVYSRSCRVTVNPKASITIKNVYWINNSAGGVEPRVTFVNNTKETIKYIHFKVQYYNAVGDKVKSDYRSCSYYDLDITGPIKPGTSESYEWDPTYYYDPGIHALRIYNVRVTYMSGKVEKISYNKLWKDKEYYYQ